MICLRKRRCISNIDCKLKILNIVGLCVLKSVVKTFAPYLSGFRVVKNYTCQIGKFCITFLCVFWKLIRLLDSMWYIITSVYFQVQTALIYVSVCNNFILFGKEIKLCLYYFLLTFNFRLLFTSWMSFCTFILLYFQRYFQRNRVNGFVKFYRCESKYQ